MKLTIFYKQTTFNHFMLGVCFFFFSPLVPPKMSIMACIFALFHNSDHIITLLSLQTNVNKSKSRTAPHKSPSIVTASSNYKLNAG